jgi:hypothetical protein
MRHTRRHRRRKGGSIVLGMAFAALLASGSYALTAANTVPASKAGDGTGTVSGYAASAINYTLNASNPANADSVAFTLDSTPPAGSELKAQVISGGTWYDCTNTGASVACALTGGVAVTAVNQLRVIAAD